MTQLTFSLDELEAMHPEDFRNPVRTPEEEAHSEALRRAKKADEKAREHRFTLTEEERAVEEAEEEDEEE